MALLLLILSICLIVVFANRRKRHGAPKKMDQQQVDELITVILPTINKDK